MKKVAFHNLGCKVNSYEMDGMMQNFQNAGYEIVDFAQKADIYIVNTCTVTNIADRKSRQMLHRAKAQNEDAIVVATGCYAQTDTAGAMQDEAIDLIVGNNEKVNILKYVEEYLKRRGESEADEESVAKTMKTLDGLTMDDLTQNVEYENFTIEQTGEHTRAYIKIQDGCNQFCSYCAIPNARGRVRSRQVDDVIEEVELLAQNGYGEVVLTGIHLSSYGLDFDERNAAYNSFAGDEGTNEALLDVIEQIARVPGIERIRLGSLEPRLITERFLNRLSRVAKVCPHFHLSLQSGSDTVLERMNRHYTADDFASRVELIRDYYEHPAITTDIIVGFPQESEEEFETTRAYAEKIDLYETHVFKYSRRKGTVADRMQGQIADSVKNYRSGIMIKEALARKERFTEYYVDKIVAMLAEEVEEIDGKSYWVGYTPEYVKCAVAGDYSRGMIVRGIGEVQRDGILFIDVLE